MNTSKAKEPKVKKAPLMINNEVLVANHNDHKPKLAYSIDKSHPIEWAVYEHEIVDNEIVKTTLITRDIKVLAKRKLELKIFFSE